MFIIRFPRGIFRMAEPAVSRREVWGLDERRPRRVAYNGTHLVVRFRDEEHGLCVFKGRVRYQQPIGYSCVYNGVHEGRTPRYLE